MMPLLLGAALSLAARADEAPTLRGEPAGGGVGVVLGEPSGIALAMRGSGKSMVQGTVGWSVPDEKVQLSVDVLYLLHEVSTPEMPNARFPLYVGLGGRMRTGGDTSFGVRVPIGMQIVPDDLALDVFVELAPVIQPFPELALRIDGGVGVRVYPF